MNEGKGIVTLEPFYLYPLKGKMLRYFMGREKELDYVMKILTISNGEILGIFGGIGSGKTSFLNMIREMYVKRFDRPSAVKIVSAKNVIWEPNGNIGLVPIVSDSGPVKVELLLVDDVADLSDKDAIEFYKKIYAIAMEEQANIVFTDKPHRSKEAERYKKWVLTNSRPLFMDLREGEVADLMRRRFAVGGLDGVFTEKALKAIAIRSGSNLRRFLKYAKEVYMDHNEMRGIGKKEVFDTIKRVDMDLINEMDEVSQTILRILFEKTSNQWGLNATMLFKYVRDELKRETLSTSTLYENLKDLLEDRFILSRRVGREVIYVSLHKLLGIDINIKPHSHGFEFEL